MFGVFADVWGNIQMYRTYRHMGGCTGGIQMYEGMYRIMHRGDDLDLDLFI